MDQILFEVDPIKKSQTFDEITYFRVKNYELEQRRLARESIKKELESTRDEWVYNASTGRSIKKVVDGAVKELLKTRKVTHRVQDSVGDDGHLPGDSYVPSLPNDACLNQNQDRVVMTLGDIPTVKGKGRKTSKKYKNTSKNDKAPAVSTLPEASVLPNNVSELLSEHLINEKPNSSIPLTTNNLLKPADDIWTDNDLMSHFMASQEEHPWGELNSNDFASLLSTYQEGNMLFPFPSTSAAEVPDVSFTLAQGIGLDFCAERQYTCFDTNSFTQDADGGLVFEHLYPLTNWDATDAIQANQGSSFIQPDTGTGINPAELHDSIVTIPVVSTEQLSQKDDSCQANKEKKQEGKHECSTCGKHLSSIRSLTRHQRIHLDIKPFECPQCDKRFSDQSSLRRHEKTHSQVKEFECQTCSKSFHTKQQLSNHELAVHEGVKRFACTTCDKRFGHRSVLYNHKKKCT